MKRRLRVVSWNVGRLYSPSHNNRLDDADIPRVARILGELDGDVLLLQELVSQAQLDAIIVQLHNENRGRFRGAIAQYCRYDRRVAAIVRSDYRPTFEEQLLEPSGRGVLLATFDVAGDAGGDTSSDASSDTSSDTSSDPAEKRPRSDGTKASGAGAKGIRAVAVSVHLDVFSPERRAEQGAALAELLQARPEPLLVAGGDLNLDPAAATALRNRLDVDTFARLSNGLIDTGQRAGATLLGLLRVDHLLMRGARDFITRVSPRRLPLGDHHPLVLDVDLDNA